MVSNLMKDACKMYGESMLEALLKAHDSYVVNDVIESHCTAMHQLYDKDCGEDSIEKYNIIFKSFALEMVRQVNPLSSK